MSDYDPNVIGSGTTWYITDPSGAVYTTDADYIAAQQSAIANQQPVAPSAAVFGGGATTPANTPSQPVSNPVVVDTTKPLEKTMTQTEAQIKSYINSLPWGGANDKTSGAKLAQMAAKYGWSNQQIANASIGTAQDWVAFWARVGITNPESTIYTANAPQAGSNTALYIGAAAVAALVLMG